MQLTINVEPLHAIGVLAGLVSANLAQIADAGMSGAFPVLRGLHDGSIRYEAADPGEEWRSWAEVQSSGYGDCEDLVCAVCAEYLAAGIAARPVAYEAMPGVWHVIIEKRIGKRYGDPSRLGGMTGSA